MKLRQYKPLALLAADADDLQVISSVLQDAVLKVGDMAWRPPERRFAFVANRFVWEEAAGKKFGPFARVRVGVHFDDVIRVRTKSVRLDARDAILDLLAVEISGEEDGTKTIELVFAGGGAIALEVDAINAELRDISEPWPTPNKPNHQDRS
ncbi:MAG: DUF2948 family protein [Parvularcula sp.]